MQLSNIWSIFLKKIIQVAAVLVVKGFISLCSIPNSANFSSNRHFFSSLINLNVNSVEYTVGNFGAPFSLTS